MRRGRDQPTGLARTHRGVPRGADPVKAGHDQDRQRDPRRAAKGRTSEGGDDDAVSELGTHELLGCTQEVPEHVERP